MSISGSGQYDQLDQLAEEFAARFRRGERPSLKEYTDRYPELADEIRKLFPALVEVEQVERFQQGEEVKGEAPALAAPLNQVGDYRILREIGRGGMGVVYEAEQISLGRRVALKVLPRHASGNRMIEERFRREARAAARLHHTNIVPVFEVGQEEDIRFYAMQFIQGQSLDLVIGELRRLRERVKSVSKPGAAALDGWYGPPLDEQLSPAVAEPTLGEGAELSQVVHSVLTGQFNPGGPPSGLVGASQSVLKRAIAGAIAPVTGTGEYTEPGPAWARTESRSTAEADATSSNASRSSALSSSSSPCPSTSSASLPGRAQLSSVESGRRAFFRSLAHIGRQVAGALAHAHARRIVHRDIKPSNLLLDTDGVAWITDFGLAKGDEEGLTESGDILGTLRYMGPERFRGEGDARADVYALGMTLYELLTLRSGFEATDRLRLIEQIKSEEPVRPRAVDARIPRDLETIVLKAIEKDPKARYQSAEAMGEDLGRFLADEPIKAREVSAAERYWRWARRNPVIAVLGGVLTGVLIAATASSMVVASYFRKLASNESRAKQQSQQAQKAAIDASQQAIRERDHSRQLSASLALDKGAALAEEGQADRGLLWMLEAIQTAPDSAEAFRKVASWNLGAWLGQVHRPLAIFDLHEFGGGPSFSPDGTTFATGFEVSPGPQSFPINLSETVTGRKLATFRGCFFPFAIAPDGKRLIATSSSWDRVLAVDLATGRELWSTPLGSGWPRWMTISPDGSSVFVDRLDKSTGSGLMMSWDAATGQPRSRPIPIGRSLAMAPDCRTLATDHIENGHPFIDLLEWPSGRRIETWRSSSSSLGQLYISPDGRTLYEYATEGDAGNADSHLGRIWDLRTRRPISALLHRSAWAAYTPAGERLLTSAGGAFVVRETATGRVIGTGPPVTGLAVDLTWQAVHPDGRTVISIQGTTASLWRISADADPAPDRDSGEPATKAGGASGHQTRDIHLFCGGLRSDGRLALAVARGPGERELVRLSDPVTGRPIGRPARHSPGWNVRALALSPDGGRFATGSTPPKPLVAGEVRLWDVATGRPVLRPMPHTNYVSALAFRPDGKVLAAGDYNGLVRFWDTTTGQEIARPVSQNEIVMSLAYSTDGQVLAVGLAPDRTREPGTRLWDARTRQPIGGLLPNNGMVDSIVFRPDSGAFIAGNMVWFRLWDVIRGQAIGEPIVDETVAGFRPDGKAFLTLGRDRSVKLRSATTGAVLGRLMTLPTPGTCGALRGDGALAAAGCEDGTVRLCDAAAAQAVGPPRSMRHTVQQVAFTADGRSVVAIDVSGDTRAWPVPEPLYDASFEDLTLRIEARTGLHMEQGLSISRLDNAAWRQRLEHLAQLDPTAVRPDDDPSWHEPMIREAERNGNAFAAIWHLDRLIAARPGDWFLYARRARAWSSSDQFDKAAADYQQAVRLGSREQVLDFQTHCVVDCTKAERWVEALWYLDRLIAARPDDWTLHEDRAAVYGKLGREADRQAELARVFEMGADAGLVLPRAEQLGREGRWPEAAALLARCARTGPLDHMLAQAWAIACLKAGDRQGYRQASAGVLARNGPEPTVVWDELNAASVLTLGAGGQEEDRIAMAWFEKRLSGVPALPPFYRHFFSSMLGGLLLRAGRVDEAIARLNEGLAASKEPEIPNDWALLAIAHARKGEPAAAHRWLDRLRAWRPDPGATFWDLQEVAVLRDELEILLLDAAFPRDPFSSSGP